MQDREKSVELSPQEIAAQALYEGIDTVYRHPKFRDWMYWEDVINEYDYSRKYDDNERNILEVNGKKVFIDIPLPFYANEPGKFRPDSPLTFRLHLEPRFDYKKGDEPVDVFGVYQINGKEITREVGFERFELTNSPSDYRSYFISPDLKPEPLGDEHITFVSNCLSVLKSTLDNYPGPKKSPIYSH